MPVGAALHYNRGRLIARDVSHLRRRGNQSFDDGYDDGLDENEFIYPHKPGGRRFGAPQAAERPEARLQKENGTFARKTTK